ncbi:MAG: SDR family oxidoreductase [Bacillati bacterium ANGP1]|uniref:SDR family oxidoreductase n=1 Tax=Candidatus Segetimicrobium genomatis TaxID=2569760 RepID=A0A537IM57_9BACT|nr:MAG: SDR family oxidoreductase [Terrabacteria group bacterium ANGP1]
MNSGVLSNKVVIITGAAGALGREAVRVFLDEGARIAACDMMEVPMDAMGLSAEARHRCMPVRYDVTTARGAADLMAHALREFRQVDALLNIVGGWKGGLPLHETPVEEWEGMLTLNLTSAFLCSRAVLPHMLERKSGRIVNISSRTAVMPAPRQAAYSAAKAGVIALTRTLAEEVKASGINVNCVLPSILDTEANRKAFPKADYGHWVKPADLARVLAFLVSDGSSQITGAAIPVYGRA